MNQQTASEPILGLFIIVAYFLGSIPFGYFIARSSGRDLRRVGSGNIGATNVVRAAGWTAGILTLLLDAGKGFVAVQLVERLSGGNIRLMALAGLAAIAGHVFPVWLGFKGGKGVATAFGAFLAISAPAVGVAALIFGIVLAFWRYVSLASVSAAAAMPLLVYVLYAPRHAPPTILSTCTLLAAALVIFRHRSNIERLADGSEPKIGRNHDDRAGTNHRERR